jgi:hypothetical protein
MRFRIHPVERRADFLQTRGFSFGRFAWHLRDEFNRKGTKHEETFLT